MLSMCMLMEVSRYVMCLMGVMEMKVEVSDGGDQSMVDGIVKKYCVVFVVLSDASSYVVIDVWCGRGGVMRCTEAWMKRRRT